MPARGTEPVAEFTEHPVVMNLGTAQPAAEPQALGPVLGAKGAVAECGRERRGLHSTEAT